MATAHPGQCGRVVTGLVLRFGCFQQRTRQRRGRGEQRSLQKITPRNLPVCAQIPIFFHDRSVARFRTTFDPLCDVRDSAALGDTHRRIGQIDTGFLPGINISPDGKTTAVATTYFARGGHGTRTDVVEFNDNNTLGKTGEIVIPPKHAQTLAMLFTIGYSSDGRFVYVPYLTPAASFGVLDPARKAVLNEIDTAGCTLVMPWGPNRVSSICESGRLLTVTLDAQGHEASRTTSEAFFNPDEDPVFAQAVPLKEGYAYLSFLGQVHEIDFTQPKLLIRTPWSLVSNTEKGTWRPGGVQIGAVHRSRGELFVLMHKGGEGSHKDGGTEIWVFDLKSHRRTARWTLNTHETGGAVAVQVSQDAAPLLFVVTEKAHLLILDARTGKLQHNEAKLGQTPQLLLNP